ncbi:histidine kinase dimerization/phospho-acceptor domain-containing protein [Pontixanthobacter luteolus]|uniref:histidine kinase dimerization/phospho-acceptor domain-containing protein n=1 Tax=Pontixanthobacter luteolus TaxID=295089 RepID=UPI0023040B9C|nr:histidine kinase dimerization/phospho-acceptor domain-containing protein [Pontixanthobacter luteolus]
MQFDDRLATVLRHRASGDRAARTQFRQLLDLLGSRRNIKDRKLLASAWLRLGALGEIIPAADRAAMVADAGLRIRNPELAVHLAEDEPAVAAAALSRAEISSDDWEALIPRLPVRARGFLRLRRDLPPQTTDLLERLGIQDRGLPNPASAEKQVQQPDSPDGLARGGSNVTPIRSTPLPANDIPLELSEEEVLEEDTEIGALVKRIEAFRKARVSAPDKTDAPRLPLGEQIADTDQQVSAFAFTADARGRIDWADQPIAPMVIGTVLDRDKLGPAIKFRQPIRDEVLELAGAPKISGKWVVDAAPQFTQPEGRFFGYAGMFRRAPDDISNITDPPASSEADRLRQLLHELKTPVNAIQGFSEVIQQQLFGPTPHEYRALAANIAGDSARMLAGFDELDRLAKLETGALDLEMGEADFAAIVAAQIEQLGRVLAPRTAAFEFAWTGAGPSAGYVPLDQKEAETLAWRLLATLAGAIGAGESIPVGFAPQDRMLGLHIDLPASLAATDDIFAATAKPGKAAVSAGMFGAGFSLRLARAEARSAGGDLMRVDDSIVLTLPLLTAAGSESSQTADGAAN